MNKFLSHAGLLKSARLAIIASESIRLAIRALMESVEASSNNISRSCSHGGYKTQNTRWVGIVIIFLHHGCAAVSIFIRQHMQWNVPMCSSFLYQNDED